MKSVQMMDQNQMQQNETINMVINTVKGDLEAYQNINASIKDLQNITQSVLPRTISNMKAYIDNLTKDIRTYIYRSFPGLYTLLREKC
jgi:hypothetical protein